MTDKVSEKGRQVHKVVFCRGYGGHFRSKPLLTRKHLFAKSYAETVSLLHDLTTVLSQVGLVLKASKTVVLTNEAQPPEHLQLPSGERIAILEHDCGQKWLGCILTAQRSKLRHVDVKHHLQQVSKAFFANRWILQDHQVSISTRLKYFDKVVACFAAGHRALYKNDLVNMDVSYRKLCRQIVGPPPGPNWSLDWHEILHPWNERVEHFAALARVKSWSQCACTHYWKFARYVARLPPHRWIKRVLAWTPPGRRTSGRPPNRWDHKLISYCRYKKIWTFGRLHQLLPALSGIFLYISYFAICSHFFSVSRLCPLGPAIFWRTGSTRLNLVYIEVILSCNIQRFACIAFVPCSIW